MSANEELRERMAEQMEFVLSQTPEALAAENAKLRELVRGMVYATHPADRARLIADAAELGVEVDE